MSTKIEYQNIFDKPISANQAAIMKDYSKLIYENNELKKIEYYYGGNFSYGEYFLSTNENLITLLESLDQKTHWSIFSNKQIVNSYEIWEGRIYNDNNDSNSLFTKNVFGTDGRLITTQEYSSNIQNPLNSIKTYYLGGLDIIENDEVIGVFDYDTSITFYFNENGEIESIDPSTSDGIDDTYQSLSRFLELESGGPLLHHMTPEMLAYYTNREPLVPNF